MLVHKKHLSENYSELISSILYDITNTNYELNFYLPDDIETIKGQNILSKDFNMGAFSLVLLDNMKTKEIIKLEDKLKEIENVNMVMSIADITGTSIPLSLTLSVNCSISSLSITLNG